LKSILRQMRMETTYQHMDAARKVWGEKFIPINIYIQKDPK
jgi:hypothetical protein